jgi:NTE family protein
MAGIGLALGGGGVRGFAHVAMLEAIEELGVKPSFVAGTSMGAVIGVLYCAGMSPAEIRAAIREVSIAPGERFADVLRRGTLQTWFRFFDLAWGGGGLVRPEGLLAYLFDRIRVRTFEDLRIPLRVVAADFWSREEVVLDRGDLVSAVQASMSLPGAFAPVVREGRVLVDGGAVNPVPFDVLPPTCDVTVAVDVLSRRTVPPRPLPSLSEAVFQTFEIMERSITRAKRARCEPDVYVETDIPDVGLLEFQRADEVLALAAPAKARLLAALAPRLPRPA